MGTLSTKFVRPILESMYECRREMVPCFIGAPGIGKTQGLYEFAKDKGVDVVTFILSNTVPSEVSGIRIPDHETKAMEVFDDVRMASLKDGDILFFDEILEAPPMLWSACLTLIQDRIMASGRKLPDVFIVAASNKVASPGVIPASTRDRFQFIELEFDFDYWRKWFKNRYGVYPFGDLARFIKEDTSSYNILTPRRICKLYEWLAHDKENQEATQTKLDVIDSMFESMVSTLLMRMVNHVPTKQEQVHAAVQEILIDQNIELPDNFDQLPLTEVLSILQGLDCWTEMESVLATTTFVEEPDNDWSRY